jgi:hypothetical protein
MEVTLRVLVSVGFALLLLMLRLEAARFGAAEYEPVADWGRWGSLRRRLAWYALGVAFTAAIWRIHPSASGDLFLGPGDAVVIAGLAFGAIGTVVAFGLGWLRFREIVLPETGSYPGGLLNAVGTAFVDEAAFRGVLLGFLVLVGVDAGYAIVAQALIYALATRQGAPGRDLALLGLSLILGLAGGWLTIETGGIGAAFVGHSISRMALFVATAQGGPLEVGEDVEDHDRPKSPFWRLLSIRGPATRDR